MKDIQQVARYIGLSLLSKEMSVSPLKLQKILYYVQSWHMVFFGREKTLFAEVPQAWVNGPVYPAVYMQYRDAVPNMCDYLTKEHFGAMGISAVEAFRQVSEEVALTAEQAELIESVVLLYGSKTQNELIFLTHAEQPWVEQRQGLQPYDRSNNEISLDTMYSYYKARYDKNHPQA